MLDQQDNETAEDPETIETVTEETPEGDDSESEELSIVIEGDAPEEEDVTDEELGEKGARAVKRLRELAKENAKKARDAERQLAEIKASTVKEVPALKKPTIADCGYDEDKFADEMRKFVAAEAEVKANEDRQREKEAAEREDYDKRHENYKSAKSSLKVQDYDEAEERVREALSPAQQSMIIRNLDDPAKVIYALGRSKKALAELAGIKDHDRFAFRLAKLEGEVKVTTRTPPPAETKLRPGSGSPGAVVSLSQQLAKAQKQAEDSGDYTEVLSLKRQMREAGTKA
jgi:hypothetical protein